MHYSHPQIVFQEVPGEISLAFSISGCNLGCNGCHSAHTWAPDYGEELTEIVLLNWLNKYPSMITTVLFYGGEWQPEILNKFLAFVRLHGLKTALYTGMELHTVPKQLLKNLTYLKTGRFVKALGGIDSPSSNQRFFNIESGEELTHIFRHTDNLISITNI